MAFSVVSQAQRARRRQQRPALDDGQRQIEAARAMDAELRAWRERRRQHRLDQLRPSAYYGEASFLPHQVMTCDARWGVALAAVRAGEPLEGQAT